LRLSRTTTPPAEPPKRFFVQLGPAPRARREGEQADALAAIAEGEDEEARATVLPRDRMPHHRAFAVVDLPFLARRGDDDGVGLGSARTAELRHVAPHARVARGEPVLIDEVLPDRHGIAAAAEGLFDQLAVRLAGAGRRRPAGPGRHTHAKVGGHLTGRICGVGGHLYGRFCGRVAPPPGRAHRQPGGFQVRPGGLAPPAARLRIFR
jgi:hypothetical protein